MILKLYQNSAEYDSLSARPGAEGAKVSLIPDLAKSLRGKITLRRIAPAKVILQR